MGGSWEAIHALLHLVQGNSDTCWCLFSLLSLCCYVQIGSTALWSAPCGYHATVLQFNKTPQHWILTQINSNKVLFFFYIITSMGLWSFHDAPKPCTDMILACGWTDKPAGYRRARLTLIWILEDPGKIFLLYSAQMKICSGFRPECDSVYCGCSGNQIPDLIKCWKYTRAVVPWRLQQRGIHPHFQEPTRGMRSGCRACVLMNVKVHGCGYTASAAPSSPP